MSTMLFSSKGVDVIRFAGPRSQMFQVTWGIGAEEWMHFSDIFSAMELASTLIALKDMDVPRERMSLTRWNVGWLQRNLGFRNSKHPQFNEVMGILIRLQEGTLCA